MTLPPQGWPAKDNHHKLFPSLCVTLNSWSRNTMVPNGKGLNEDQCKEMGKQKKKKRKKWESIRFKLNSLSAIRYMLRKSCISKGLHPWYNLGLGRQIQEEGEKKVSNQSLHPVLYKNHPKVLNVQREANVKENSPRRTTLGDRAFQLQQCFYFNSEGALTFSPNSRAWALHEIPCTYLTALHQNQRAKKKHENLWD